MTVCCLGICVLFPRQDPSVGLPDRTAVQQCDVSAWTLAAVLTAATAGCSSRVTVKEDHSHGEIKSQLLLQGVQKQQSTEL